MPNIIDEAGPLVTIKESRNLMDSLQDSNRTTKRIESKESIQEIRQLLEYLFLDVKVRSPEEVSQKLPLILSFARFSN